MRNIYLVLLILFIASCGKVPNPIPVPGPQGPPGEQGPKGDKGDTGENGATCVVEQVLNGATVTCGGSSVTISNGVDGHDGEDATPVQATVFCPSLEGGIGFKEIGITLGNSIYAVYYDGTHTFLTLLKPGNYITTDGRNCHFTIKADGTIL